MSLPCLALAQSKIQTPAAQKKTQPAAKQENHAKQPAPKKAKPQHTPTPKTKPAPKPNKLAPKRATPKPPPPRKATPKKTAPKSPQPKRKKPVPVETQPEVKVETIEPEEEEQTEAGEREPSPETSAGAARTEETEDSEHRPRVPLPWLELGVEGGAITRHFDYRDEQSGALRGFYLRGAPVLGASLTLFPFASSRSAASVWGLEAAYSRVLGVTSQLGGRSYDTSASAYRVQLVANFPVSNQVALRPKLGYQGRTLFVVGNAVPDLHEHGPRAGLELRFRFAPLLVELDVGAQYLLSGGELTSAAWFPSTTGFAADARLRAGWIMASPFELLLQGGIDYASFAFSTRPSDPHPNGIAGGAYDVARSLSLVGRLLLR
ncbi:MAG: hypothetical protein ACOY0T_09590 [Myxococcota bacterium]